MLIHSHWCCRPALLSAAADGCADGVGSHAVTPGAARPWTACLRTKLLVRLLRSDVVLEDVKMLSWSALSWYELICHEVICQGFEMAHFMKEVSFIWFQFMPFKQFNTIQ